LLACFHLRVLVCGHDAGLFASGPLAAILFPIARPSISPATDISGRGSVQSGEPATLPGFLHVPRSD